MITAAFAPEVSPRAFRATELAQELCRQGHKVDVLTDKENTFDETIKGLILLKRLFRRKPNRFQILDRLKWSRVAEHFFEYPDIGLMWEVKRELLKLRGHYDAIISIAAPFPVHWGTALGLTRPNLHSQAIWIADCGDPYMGVQLHRYRRPFYFAYFEHHFCKLADYIVVPTKGSIEGYYSQYHDKIKVIPQGFAMDLTPPTYKPNPIPTFAYAGAISLKGPRNPIPFIQALQDCRIDFRFHLFSANATQIAQIAKDHRIIGHSSIPRKKLLKELGKMDFLVNFDNGTTRQTPSKLIDYTLAGRPIYNLRINNIEIEKLQAFLQGDYRFAYHVADFAQYDIQNVAAKFLGLIQPRSK